MLPITFTVKSVSSDEVLSKMTQAATHPICICWYPVLTVATTTLSEIFCEFPPSSKANTGTVPQTMPQLLPSTYLLPNSLLTNNPTIQHYTVWATDSIIKQTTDK
jgi:hypothetical protein